MAKDRRLAAIMFTDIVGYTSLMEEEEKRAFQLLEKNRKIHKPIIKKYKGKWLKEMGDGILVSFQTVTDSVLCAIEIQEACKNEPDLKLRIGIHQGEVTFQGDDVFGSGVNIASRLEEIAPISGIYVSESVYRNIHNISAIKAEFIKEETLKNVKHPIRIYKVSIKEGSDKIIQPDIKRAKKRKPYLIAGGILILFFVAILIWTKLPIKSSSKIDPKVEKSIALLPFKNLSEDQNNQYFCDGVMEGILNNLSQIKDLRVLSRSSTDKYRESTPPVPQIAEELDVNYLVEASVFKSEIRIRVTVQLIDALKDEYIWSQQYDREINDIFTVMSDISKEVASEIKVFVGPEVKERIEFIPTENMEAYELYLKGREYQRNYRAYRESNKSLLSTAIYFYKKAIELDPDFALVYLWLGQAYELYSGSFTSDYLKESYLDTFSLYIEKALSIDPNLAKAYSYRSSYLIRNGKITEAIKQSKKAIDLDPNDGDGYWILADGYKAQNEYVNAIQNYLKAKKLLVGTEGYMWVIKDIGNLYEDISYTEKAESSYKELLIFDPVVAYSWLHGLAHTHGEWDDMKYYTDQICKIDSGFLCQNHLMSWYIHTEAYDKAKKYFEDFSEERMDQGNQLWDSYLYGYVLLKLGRSIEAKKLFHQQINISNELIRLNRAEATGLIGGFANYTIVACFILLGEKEKALQVLHEMENNAFSGRLTSWIRVDPIFEDLWDNEEFKAIIYRQEKKFADIRAEIDKLEEEGEL